MNHEVVELPGLDLYLRAYGNPQNPAVLCLHSLFLDGTMFHDWAEFASPDLFVLTPDFRGQGQSVNHEDFHVIDMDLNAADTLAFVDTYLRPRGISSIGIVAQSMGGDVGLRVAHLRPGLVSKIALLGSSACAEPTDQLDDFRIWVRGVESSGFTDETLEYTVRVMLGESCRNDPRRNGTVQAMRRSIGQLDASLLPAMRGVVERASYLDRLADISIPVLIFSGNEDWARPPQWSMDMHSALPNSELIQMAEVGHSPIVEVPEQVFGRLRDFFLD